MPNLINASTSSGLVTSADTSGTIELQSNGTTRLTVSSAGAYGQLVSATAQASTSGTNIDFTGIPSWVKRITVMFQGVSKSGTADLLVQSGSGSIENTGYGSCATLLNDASAIIGAASTIGYRLSASSSGATNFSGIATLVNINSNIWILNSVLSNGNAATWTSAGTKSFSGVIDRVRITTTNGTDTFDAGTINILYEG